MKRIRSLAFVVNEEKPGAMELARTLIAMAKEAGVKTRGPARTHITQAALRGVDACCVIGVCSPY